MQTYKLKLEAAPSVSFRCQKAANSLDIDVKKKLTHEMEITCDIESDYSIGLILGASGSGKTTLAKKMFGDNIFDAQIDSDKTIIDLLPDEWTYDQCAEALSGIGLSSVNTWIRPIKTLSNGQKARCEGAYLMTKAGPECPTVIDEWTSVVDRTVAKVMSHSIQKFARRNKKKLILLSCHYDVVDWLNPDWVIDCNNKTWQDRRSLRPDDRKRKELLEFEIREVDRSTWPMFSKYHYLSDKMAGGKNYTFGLFHGENQIGFQAYSNYVPRRKNALIIFHSNRVVVHPDYAGLGLGIKFVNETAKIMALKGYRIMTKFSSIPMFKSHNRDPNWKLIRTDRQIGILKAKVKKGSTGRRFNNENNGGHRNNVLTWTFEYIQGR